MKLRCEGEGMRVSVKLRCEGEGMRVSVKVRYECEGCEGGDGEGIGLV